MQIVDATVFLFVFGVEWWGGGGGGGGEGGGVGLSFFM